MELPVFYDLTDDWNRTMFLYDSALRQVNTKLEIMSNQFKMTDQYNPIEHITSRIKSPESIAKKMAHNNRELTVPNIVKYINDVAGVRIICSFESEIYKIAGLIKKQADIKILKVKDYIMFPKENGYASYHMIVSVPVYMNGRAIETKVEIQIRTIAMDFWASLEHKMYYKFEGNAPESIRKELKECADIVAFLDKKMMAINNEIKEYKGDERGTQLANRSYTDDMNYGMVVDDDESENVSVEAAKEVEVVAVDVDIAESDIKEVNVQDNDSQIKSLDMLDDNLQLQQEDISDADAQSAKDSQKSSKKKKKGKRHILFSAG